MKMWTLQRICVSFILLLLIVISIACYFDNKKVKNYPSIFIESPGYYDKKYGKFSEKDRFEMVKLAKNMFQFGYDNYMKYAFPQDELNPIYCKGRGPDIENPSNININDVLGNYSLTLIDALDTLVVMGNNSEFQRAVKLVVDNISFDKDSIVQVFEVNIRILGALISAHLLLTDKSKLFGDLRPSWYNDELLELANDLATRLLPAFEKSTTGLPYPRVNLRYGLPQNCEFCQPHTCTSGAGSLLLEFGLLSRLVNNSIFDSVARRAAKVLWLARAKGTGLVGNVIDVETGQWIGRMSGVGAGIDSFYEYLLKSYILFGEIEDHKMFNESYHIIKRYLRKGRTHCNSGTGKHPLYVNVDMNDGSTSTLWIDSLQASWAGVQVLAGDIEEAICTHALYYNIWRLFDGLPERFNWQRVSPEVSFYPLRPELAESTYLLFQATKNPFYLHVGRDMLFSLENYTKAECGYATIHNVQDKSLEDRMESFFLSETCKYLYLLFDIDNPLHKDQSRYIFSTEGHIFPIDIRFRKEMKKIRGFDLTNFDEIPDETFIEKINIEKTDSIVISKVFNNSQSNCHRVNSDRLYLLPLKNEYFHQISEAMGLEK